MLARFCIISCFLCAISCAKQSYAQSISAAFDPPGRSRFYFNPGDDMKFKIKNQPGMLVMNITLINDSGIVFDNRYFAYYTDIDKITLFPRKRVRGLKKIMAFGGLVFPGVSAANAIFNKNIPKDNLGYIALGAVPFAATYLGLKMNDWVGVTYNTKRNRIKPVVYNPYNIFR